MTQQDDRQSEKSDRIYREREERSRNFLEKMDRLAAEIAAASPQKKLRGKLERERATTGTEFAKHLDNQGMGYLDSRSRSVVAVWRVTKVPSKKRRAEAKAWMAQRGLEWDGSAPRLRYEVRKALERGEPIPEGRFGLHVERTVAIELPQAFTMNILGEAVHVAPSEKPDIGVIIKDALEDFIGGKD